MIQLKVVGKVKQTKNNIHKAFLNKKGRDALHKYFNSKLKKQGKKTNDPLHMIFKTKNKDNKPNSEH